MNGLGVGCFLNVGYFDLETPERVATLGFTLISGCDDLYKHSVISWCEYIDHEPDTTFAFGFRSLLDIYRRFLKEVCGTCDVIKNVLCLDQCFPTTIVYLLLML